jgi:hypothetical protein
MADMFNILPIVVLGRQNACTNACAKACAVATREKTEMGAREAARPFRREEDV